MSKLVKELLTQQNYLVLKVTVPPEWVDRRKWIGEGLKD
jgi:hypothetical protein